MDRTRSLLDLGIDTAPSSSPLSYPGLVPAESGLLVDDLYLRLIPGRSVPLGRWEVMDADFLPLDTVLAGLGRPPISERRPVVCVGSNAAPAQMYAKLTRRSIRPVLPMVRAEVQGIRPGVSAHVSRPGYLPATPVADPDVTSALVVVWLDEAQLAAVEETEPNYRRLVLPAEAFPVRLPSGLPLTDPGCYASRHGCLVAATGVPRALKDQEALIEELLADVPGLRRLCGITPQEWLARTAAENVREAVRVRFRDAGVVLDQGGLCP
ncbi:MAG: hypothetical protein ABIS86_11820 [Streptosporangiaceae bacterium]